MSSSALELRLISILFESSKQQVQLRLDQREMALRELGVSSVMVLNFLIAIEDTLGVEWPEETPREVFRSLASIAGYLSSKVSLDA